MKWRCVCKLTQETTAPIVSVVVVVTGLGGFEESR